MHSIPSMRKNQIQSQTNSETCLSKKLANKQLNNVDKDIQSLTFVRNSTERTRESARCNAQKCYSRLEIR